MTCRYCIDRADQIRVVLVAAIDTGARPAGSTRRNRNYLTASPNLLVLQMPA